MAIVVDASVIIAVLVDEPQKARLLEVTAGQDLLMPESVPWEVGNAFSAMVKRKRIIPDDAVRALKLLKQMALETVPVNLVESVRLAAQLGLYAYDAYLLTCARDHGCSLLTLDRPLSALGRREGFAILEFAS